MAKIVGVHGIMNQQRGRHQLIRTWGPALADGIERAASRPVVIPEMDIAFYGDLFLPVDAMNGPKGTLAEGLNLTDDDADALAPIVEEISGQEGLNDMEDENVKGRTRVPLAVQRLLRLLDRRFQSRAASLLFVGELKQVRRYLLDPTLKAEVDERVTTAVRQGCRVLIGHSLGSVVAFEAIRQQPHHEIRLLLTLGSPLSLQTVQALMPNSTYGSHWPPQY